MKNQLHSMLCGLALVGGIMISVPAVPAMAQSHGEESSQPHELRGWFKSKRQKAKEDAEKNKGSEPSKKEKAYDDIIKEAAVDSGLVVTITKEEKLYFQLPDSIYGKPLLITNRIAQTSNTREAVAGQMVSDPVMVRFEKQGEDKVFMYLVGSTNFVDEGDPITPSFNKNYRDPVLASFEVEALKGQERVINVTRIFMDGSEFWPTVNRSGDMPKSQISGAAHFTAVKSFPNNVEVKTLIPYGSGTDLYTIEMHRSVVLLPDTPMQMRLQDNRVGYFSSVRSRYSTKLDKIEDFQIIHRWRLEPSDPAAYQRGELVAPVKPIVFYVDTVFPQAWRDAVLQGVEDWNAAFEAAGFRNAIQARLYPSKQEMPDFDPDDMRYSCVKYATTSIANAMGPSYVDPRSGEILCADVIWYHNVVSLLHNWRFVQTAAVDPRVRTLRFPDQVMAESMRYVAAHEIGHTLGLMHNMGASYSFPVEKLRDPQFTQKHGTTPSIMDYARNNYVAQPGDMERGVRLTPPLLGVYDIYAINWGYRIIPGIRDYRDEKNVLNSWIDAKKHDPMYVFGAQQMTTSDPTAQTEDLGNDHIAAGNYAIKNLKVIAANFDKWLAEPGKTDEDLRNTYRELFMQYSRHISHVIPYVGGRIYHEYRQGEEAMPVTYVPKAKQKLAVQWIGDQLRDASSWLLTDHFRQKFDNSDNYFDAAFFKILPSGVINTMLSNHRLLGIVDGYKSTPSTGYTLSEFADDFAKSFFAASYSGRKLTENDMAIESAALDAMIGLAAPAGLSNSRGLVDLRANEWMASLTSTPLCMHDMCSHEHSHSTVSDHSADGIDFFRANMMPEQPLPYQITPIMLSKLEQIRTLYKQRGAAATDTYTKGYYRMWELTFRKIFDQN